MTAPLPLLLALALVAQAPPSPPSAAARQRVDSLLLVGRYEEAARAAAGAGLEARAGEAWLAIGRWDDAAAAFGRATRGGGRDSLRGRLGQAELAALRGARAEARRGWRALIAAYNRSRSLRADELLAVATAAERLSAAEPVLARDALRGYDEAIAADPADLEPRLRAAALLQARYNFAEARTAFEDVLRRSPAHPRALLGIAESRRALMDADPVPPAESALVRNPNLVEARVFLARMKLEADDWAGAALESARALSVNPRSREALAVRAALAVVRGDTARLAAIERDLGSADTTYAEHWVAAAEALARMRRYADAAALAERAVARDPASWRGWAVLGANLLRRARIAAGRTALETAFRGDPFDPWTKNTLDLLDTLQRYPETSSRRFRFVIDAKESAALTPYFAATAEEAYERLAARYGFTPPTPIRVEVFPTHADFSVRTVGLAGIGALGVCFGPVIAMDSPSARDRGAFNWGSTLWHEIAHVFHLERSRYRVPRWLTEGLAVHEERRARPGWGDAASPQFLAAFAAGSLPPLSRLNDGFVRPPNPQAIGFAYLLASYAAEWLEATWGAPVFVRMLDGYGRGLDSRTISDSILGAPLDTIDARFDAWMHARFAPRIAALDDLARVLVAGHAAARAGRADEAQRHFERARQLFPEYAGPDSPYRGLARLSAQRGDRAGAAASLAALLQHDATAYDAAIELAGHLDAIGRAEEAAAAREQALSISPLDPALHEQLAVYYTRAGRHALAVRERRAIVALAPIDRARAWFRLAQALEAAGQGEDARRAVLRSLETAPGDAEAQELLLRLRERRP